MDKDKRNTYGIFFKNNIGYAYVLPVRKNTDSEENKVIKAIIK
jgi:hypothetical protein